MGLQLKESIPERRNESCSLRLSSLRSGLPAGEKSTYLKFFDKDFSESGEAASALRMQKILALRWKSWRQALNPGTPTLPTQGSTAQRIIAIQIYQRITESLIIGFFTFC
jgi:hypothetical protein